jgi:hypothetical protein
MAQRMHAVCTDDLHGSGASRSVRFSYAGTDYEIDLRASNSGGFAEALMRLTGAVGKTPADHGAAPGLFPATTRPTSAPGRGTMGRRSATAAGYPAVLAWYEAAR